MENFICLVPEFWDIYISYSPLPPLTSLFQQEFMEDLLCTKYVTVQLLWKDFSKIFHHFFWVLPMLFSKLELKYWFYKNLVFKSKEVIGFCGKLMVTCRFRCYTAHLISWIASSPAYQGYYIFLKSSYEV